MYFFWEGEGGGVFTHTFRPFPFPLPFLPFPLFPRLKVAPQIQLKDLGNAVSFPRGKTTLGAS